MGSGKESPLECQGFKVGTPFLDTKMAANSVELAEQYTPFSEHLKSTETSQSMAPSPAKTKAYESPEEHRVQVAYVVSNKDDLGLASQRDPRKNIPTEFSDGPLKATEPIPTTP